MGLELRFMNVGYGEAILLRCPTKDEHIFTMLIDGGSGEDAEYLGHPARIPASQQLASLGITHLDVVLNTHIHEDHTCGLPQILRDVDIGAYWCCPLPAGMETWQRLHLELAGHPSGAKFQCALNAQQDMLCALRARGVPVCELMQGSKPAVGCDELFVEVLGPSGEEARMMQALLTSMYTQPDEVEQKAQLLHMDSIMNNHSVILRLAYRGVRILLCGDTNAEGFYYLDEAQLKADVFKLGHHGQLDSATPALVKAVSPRALAVCASSDRRYNSMHPDVLRMFEAHDPGTMFLLSDTPDLPPWTCGVPVHSAAVLTIGEDGRIRTQYCTTDPPANGCR